MTDAPDPEALSSPEAFTAGLRAMKVWAGDLSLRDLQRATGIARSTLADAFNARRPGLPRLELVTAVVRACGGCEEYVARWQRTWRTLQGTRPPTGDPPARPLPAQVPRDVNDFTGRGDQVSFLIDALAQEPSGGRPNLVAIVGAAGVGKTSLAVHVAHRVASRFPDGQLYCDLRGNGTHATAAGDVLACFLRGLGVDDSMIPQDAQERAATFRSVLAQRRVLILLDDAHDSGQVRPLIPASSGSAVVVTSRSPLPGLDGFTRVELDVLPNAEAEHLFTRIVGSAAAGGEPEAARQILQVCAGLPLAIRIAASRVAAEPGWTVQSFAERLSDQRRWLDALAVEDLAVRASFAMSHQRLSPPAARAFALLGAWGTPYIGLPAGQALLSLPPDETQQIFRSLLGVHLLQSPRPGMYRLHALLRAYAAELADEQPQVLRDAAIIRMICWYLHTAHRADQALGPMSDFMVLPSPPDDVTPLEFASHEQARGWFDDERRNLIVATRVAMAHHLYGAAWQLAVSQWQFFRLRRFMADWIEVYAIARAAALRLGDTTVLGRVRLMEPVIPAPAQKV